VSGWLISAFFIFLATFLVWKSQQKQSARLQRVIDGLQGEVGTLQEQMRSKILVSCGRAVPKSVLSADGQTWYRARLDLKGINPVPDIEATIIELHQDGKPIKLPEVLALTMYPGMTKKYPDDYEFENSQRGKARICGRNLRSA